MSERLSRDALKALLLEAVDRRASDIIAIGERIWRSPELGFKEVKTARLVEETLRQLGLAPKTGLAFTGVRADVAGGRGGGPTFALIGELDALGVAGHPAADPTTGAAHACGHNAQIAGMLGAAMAICDTGVMRHLAGRVAFFAVPAEEGGDLEWRMSQRARGRARVPRRQAGADPPGPLRRRGPRDDDPHDAARGGRQRLACRCRTTGASASSSRYVGRAAHAGGAPHMGINALYAAQIGLMAINALRETFVDDDTIRVHPILTHGGAQVNVIPGEARIETYVRGRTLDAVVDANAKVDRALRAGALALGATVEIDTLPGYLPLDCDRDDGALLQGQRGRARRRRALPRGGPSRGLTDMGDLSQVMPVLHPYMGGARGTGHAADYEIADPSSRTSRPRRPSR